MGQSAVWVLHLLAPHRRWPQASITRAVVLVEGISDQRALEALAGAPWSES